MPYPCDPPPCRESAVHGFASVQQLRKLRAQAKAAGKAPAAKTIGPKPAAPGGLSYDARVQAYTLPFPGEGAARSGCEVAAAAWSAGRCRKSRSTCCT
jgi:hypothetical protein